MEDKMIDNPEVAEMVQTQIQEVSKDIIEKSDDKELSKIIMSMEDKYPHLSRLPDFKIIGFEPKSGVPIYMKTWYERSRYSCEKLRQLRKERGVGKNKNRTKKYSMNVKSS